MEKMYKYSFILLLALMTSCTAEEGYKDLSLDKSVTSEMSGDWYVQVFLDGELTDDYFIITTSNTSSDKDTEIQIYDHKNFWWFNAAVPVNLESLTFSGTDLASSVPDDDASTPDILETYDITVTITNGIIAKGDTTSTTGRTTDSISFDIEFSDGPGTIYHMEGYKRTGFLEDEH